jgi:hypothetical protein
MRSKSLLAAIAFFHQNNGACEAVLAAGSTSAGSCRSRGTLDLLALRTQC